MKKHFFWTIILCLLPLLITSCSLIPPKQEQNDWSSIWIEHANQDQKPRILFVGDSITDGYYNQVSENLAERYFPAWYTTSKFVSNPDLRDELKVILRRYQFEVVQLNNGLHGWDYSEEDYRKGLVRLIRMVKRREPGANLVWVLTTPVRMKDNLDYLDPLNQQVILRNEIALEVMEKEGIPVIDLYTEMLGHPEYYRSDGFHFNEQGKTAQAELITAFYQDYP